MKSIRLLALLLLFMVLNSCQISTDLGKTGWQEKDVRIYYVKDNLIDREQRTMSYDVVSITEYWLEKNGFPEDCKLEYHILTRSFEELEEIDFSAYYRIDISDQYGKPALYLFFSPTSKTYFEQSDGLYRQAYISTMCEYVKSSGMMI